MKRLLPAAILFSGLLIGCQPSEESMAQGVAPKTKPAGVRVINLTGATLGVQVTGLTHYDIPAGGITPGLLVSSKKPASVNLEFGATKKVETVQCEQGKFSTVVVRSKDDVSTFISGSPLSIPSKAIIECVNITDKELTFEANNGEEFKVKPKDSVGKELDPGSLTIKCNGASIDLKFGGTEIIAIYPVQVGGKTELKSRSLKGTGGTVATGGPSAS
jgi:hypothetical protein